MEKVKVQVNTSEYSKTYAFYNEDHTIGNSLRYVLMRQPSVDFCGYTVPHPSEPLMHVRLQTKGETSDEVLRQGIEDLKSCSQIVLEEFNTQVALFQ